MKPEKNDPAQVVSGTTKEGLTPGKNKKFKIFGIVAAALLIGAIGTYMLVFSKASPICPPGQIIFGDQCCNVNQLINGNCVGLPLGNAQLARGETLAAGKSLVAGGILTGGSPAYRLTMQGDGNLVVYNPSRQPVWSSGTAGTGTSNRLVLQTDGNLVIYTAGGAPVWNSGTVRDSASTSGDKLVMQSDGNLVLYSSAGAVWSSYTGKIGGQPPTNTGITGIGGGIALGPQLVPLQPLTTGFTLVSNGQAYKLVMQGDGNLVVYNSARQAVWNSGTAGTGTNNRLILQADGNLVVYTAANKAVWNSGTASGNSGGILANVNNLLSKLVMQPDGNLVLYTTQGPSWSSYTGRLK